MVSPAFDEAATRRAVGESAPSKTPLHGLSHAAAVLRRRPVLQDNPLTARLQHTPSVRLHEGSLRCKARASLSGLVTKHEPVGDSRVREHETLDYPLPWAQLTVPGYLRAERYWGYHV